MHGKIITFFFGSFFAALLGLASIPLVAWIFSAEDVGRLSMLTTVLGLSSTLVGLELHQSYVRDYHESENHGLLLKSVMAPGFFVYLALALFLSFYSNEVSGFVFGKSSGALTFALAVGVFGSFVYCIIIHVIRMSEMAGLYSISQIALKFNPIILLLIGYFICGLDADAYFLIISYVVGLLISTGVTSWLIREKLKRAWTQNIDWRDVRKKLGFCLPLVVSGLVIWILNSIDRFFIREYSGFSDLAVYSVAISFSSAMLVIYTIFSSIWHPIVYKWLSEGLKFEKFQIVAELTIVCFAVLWSFVGLFSGLLTKIVPNNYGDIEFLVVGCVGMPLLLMLMESTSVGIGISRRTIVLIYISGLSLLVNLTMNYYLVPLLGASGSAVSMMVSYFILFSLKTEFSARLWHPLRRIKIYFVVALYLFYAIYIVVAQPDSKQFKFVWIVLFIFTLFLFKNGVYSLRKSVLYLKA